MTAGHGFKKHVESLVLVQPAEGQQERRPDRREVLLAGHRLGALRGDEIGQEVGPLLGPAQFGQILHDFLCVADQVVAFPIVLDVVIAAQAGHVDEVPLGALDGRPVHPGDDDIGLETPDLALQGRCRPEIEKAPEGKLGSFHSAGFQGLRPPRVVADHHALFESRPAQGLNQADEEGLLEEVLVTGSQIRGADIEGMLPVSVLSRADMDATGATSGELKSSSGSALNATC